MRKNQSSINAFFNTCTLFYINLKNRALLRLDQELMVLRYIFLCKPSRKTVLVFTLRLCLLFIGIWSLLTIQSAFRLNLSPTVQLLFISLYAFIITNVIWEFGYTLHHIKRFGLWLIFIFILQGSLLLTINEAKESSHSLKISSSQYTSMKAFQNAGLSRKAIFKNGLTDTQNNLRRSVNQNSELTLLSLEVNTFGSPTKNSDINSGLSLLTSPETVEENTVAELVGDPLNYPNPFRLKEGTTLGYRLSKNMDIEIRIYDMRANEIFKEVLPAGTAGAQGTYNTLFIDPETFYYSDLSAGIYFFLIMNEGKVLGKGKMAVIP